MPGTGSRMKRRLLNLALNVEVRLGCYQRLGNRREADRLQERIAASEALTAENDGMRLFVAMNYGGRSEIVDAARRFAAECGPDAGEAEFAQFLYAPHMRDPQLIIRTSGEQRISNFLLWQGAYAELVFSPRLWPDFGPEDLESAMAEYGRRHRRFGGR